MQSKRIDPKGVGEFRVAGGDVTDDTLVEAEFRKQAKAGREALLAMQPLFFDCRKYRRCREAGVHPRRRLIPGRVRLCKSLRCVHFILP